MSESWMVCLFLGDRSGHPFLGHLLQVLLFVDACRSWVICRRYCCLSMPLFLGHLLQVLLFVDATGCMGLALHTHRCALNSVCFLHTSVCFEFCVFFTHIGVL